MTILVLLLFSGFFVGTLGGILAMLGRRRTGQELEHFRLFFFFVACLMLVCLIPLWCYDLLTWSGWVSNMAAVGASVVGWALTFRGKGLPRQARDAEQEKGIGIRTYMVYYQGEPYGLIARGAFDRLMANGLLKKQRTVELVDDYRERARQQGIEIQLFKSRDGRQTLIKVEMVEPRRSA